jgi:integrase
MRPTLGATATTTRPRAKSEVAYAAFPPSGLRVVLVYGSVRGQTIRHATAMSLLRSGVDINTIRIWLGHVSLQTTHIYAESDLKMKAQALARCKAPLLHAGKKLTAQKGLMGFLTMI